ncbi:MAG: hypothetical protein MI924_33960, partial [Chloroflexales bacterium]|nr:hypothetical protein [Chloroflexales bacterium]
CTSLAAAFLPAHQHCFFYKGMMLGPDTPYCSYDAVRVGYTFVRHIGLILDELSSQGLAIRQDEQRRWHWRWIGTTLQSARGFWALGEAVVDAVVTRYPTVFDSSGINSIK